MKKEKKTKAAVKAAAKPVPTGVKNEGLPVAPVKGPSLFAKAKAVVWSRTTALLTLFAVMFLAVFSTMRDSFFGPYEEAFLTSIKAPFYKIRIASLSMDYPPYFLINLAVIFACIFIIYLILAGKSRTPRPGPAYKKIFLNLAVFAAAAALYISQLKMFLAGKHYVIQGVFYVLMVMIFAVYCYILDRGSGIEPWDGKLLKRPEGRNLLLFSGIMFIVYIWDYASWKYCFIGDEYAFYDYAVKIAKGELPLQFFYEVGVSGDHPVLASIYPGALMKIFGTGLLGWKINSALIPAITAIPLYMWMKMIFKKRAAVIATVAFAFSAAMLAFAHISHDVVHSVFPFVLSFLALELAIRKNSKFWSFAAGLALAFGCYSFYTSRLTVLAAGLYWFFHPLRRKYAVSNLAAGLSIYLATIAFIFLNPAFADHMLVHSVFKGSEVGNPADRPLYMAANFITTFFAFLFKPNMSHFIAGSTAEWLTATGALAGIAWCVLSLKKDWRARWLLSSYAVLVFFVGAIVQYTYSPNTRVNFLAPMFSILAGVGLSRLIAAARFFRKNPFTRYRAVFYSVTALMILNSIWYFYVYNPRIFPYTPESYIVKYMQEKSKPGKTYIMVTDQFIRDTRLPELYKFPKGFACEGMDGLIKDLKDNSARGKTFIISSNMMKLKPDAAGLVKKGCTLFGSAGAAVAYVFDLADEKYYNGFKELILTGKTSLPLEEPEQPPVIVNGVAEKPFITEAGRENTKIRKNVRSKFITGIFYRNLQTTLIDKYTAEKLDFNSGLGRPCDIAVTQDGKKIFIADGDAKKISVFSVGAGNIYSLERRFSYYPERKGAAAFFAAPANRGQDYLYICLDRATGEIFALDPDRGSVRCFSAAGEMKKEIISEGSLVGARSLRIADSGIMLCAAVPGQNMIFVFTTTGELVNNLVTSYGSGLGQLARPAFACFGQKSGIFTVDTNNDRVQYLDDNFNYRQFYRLGAVSAELGSQILCFDGEKVPYFMATQPFYKRLLLYPINENRLRMLELKNIKGADLTAPNALAIDANGAVYILDSRAKTVLKVVLPKDVINDPPRMPGQGR